jgi:hypothetical protein
MAVFRAGMGSQLADACSVFRRLGCATITAHPLRNSSFSPLHNRQQLRFPRCFAGWRGRRLRLAADAARLQLLSGNLVRRAVLKRKVQHLGEKICFNRARDDAREVMLNSVFEPGPAPHGL